jgi:hypothetical protein
MGQTQSSDCCRNLNSNLNLHFDNNPSIRTRCNLHECIERVEGLESNSSSCSDTWIVDFLKGTHFDGIPIAKGFFKIWINGYEPSLVYETEVYREVIKPLIDLKISPNFVRLVGYADSRSIDNLVEMIVGKATVSDDILGQSLTLGQAYDSLLRNLGYMKIKTAGRPRIDTIHTLHVSLTDHYKDVHDFYKKALDDWTYDFFVTESVPEGTLNFIDWLQCNIDEFINQTQRYWKLIFQFMSGCYVMELSKLIHNDTRNLNNVWIEPIKNKTKYIYIIDGTSYVLETNEKIMIYDFDLAYAEQLGANEYLNNSKMDMYNIKNKFAPMKDVIRFFKLLYYQDVGENKNNILDLLSRNDIEADYMHSLLSNDHYFQYKKGKSASTKMMEKFIQLDGDDGVLNRVARLAGIPINGKIPKNKENVFICNRTMFSSDGILNIDKQR